MIRLWNGDLKEPSWTTLPYSSRWRASDQSGLRQALVLTAEFGLLRGEREAFAQCLRDTGAPLTLRPQQGLIPGVYRTAAVSQCARQALAHSAAWITYALVPITDREGTCQ
jgi:acetyl esterase/lipase